MNAWSKLYAPLSGRILLGGYFVGAGVQKAFNFDTYHANLSASGLPHAYALALAGCAIETLAGIALIVDFKTSIASLVLCLYLVATIVSAAALATGNASFAAILLERLAIVGGLLLLTGSASSKGWH